MEWPSWQLFSGKTEFLALSHIQDQLQHSLLQGAPGSRHPSEHSQGRQHGVSDRVGDGSWMSRTRDGWTEETLLGQESRQKAKRGGGGYRGGDGGTGDAACLTKPRSLVIFPLKSLHIFPKSPLFGRSQSS